MKIEFINEPNDLPKLKFSVEVIASDFLASCIASMGLEYEEILKLANAKLADSLYNQNFPDCHSEPYKENSSEGEELQESLQELNEFLWEQKDKRLANLNPSILNPSARPVGVGTVRTNVTILPSTKEKAKRIGDGNVSKGIDIAVERF